LAAFESLLEVRDLHTYYGDSYVLQGVDLRLKSGQVVAILGRNGMGKTTLIRSIFGLTPPRSGEVLFKGKAIQGTAPYRMAGHGMSLVAQGRQIFKNLSVRENLLLPISSLATRRLPQANGQPTGTSTQHWTFDSVLAEFPQLKDRLENGGNELSGGEQQMLAIGRALINNPELVLMDEPSEGLSPLFVQHIGTMMARLKTLGHSVLLVEQNLALALSVADYVYIIASGRFVFAGTPKELAEQEEILDVHLGVSGSKSLDSLTA